MNIELKHQDSPIQLDEVYLDVNGVALHVVQAGSPDGEPVLLLHGFPEFWYGWRHQIPALAAAGYRVWVPDQRGYNLSSKPRDVEAYRMKQLVGDVIALIDLMGHERVHLIGHDWGGAVAWTVALRHPDRLKKLGMINMAHPVVFAQTVRSDLRQMLKSWYMGLFQIPLLPEIVLTSGDAMGAATAMFHSANPGTFNDTEIAQYIKAWKRPGAMTAMINWYRALGHSPSQGMPHGDMRVHVPTLLIWGTNDIALDTSMAQPSIDLCDDGRLVTIPDAGHWVAHEKPDQVNRLLLDFLK